MELTSISGEAWWRSPYWQGELPGFERPRVPLHQWDGRCEVCGCEGRGWVKAERGVPSHLCRQCAEHCNLERFLLRRGRLV